MSVQRLSRRLQRNYNAAIQTAVQREQAALQRLANEFASADENRRQYLLWQVRRQGGIVSNIAEELSRSSETALQMIRGESLNQFAQGYRDTVGNLQRQVRDMGMSVDWNMIDRNALNVIFNGEGHEVFSQVVSLDRSRGNFFYQRAGYRLMDTRQVINRLQDELAQSIIVGETQRQRMQRIQRVMEQMKPWQARRIAQTEMAKAQSAGRYLAAEQAEKEYGLPMLKTWHHKSGQENPRLKHEGLNGKTIPKNESFDVDGEPMMYSQDVNASARNIINCHCSITYRVDTAAMQINRLNNADDGGIMESRGGVIDNFIESRHPIDVPPPFGAGLDERQQDILNRLPGFGSETIVKKRDVSMLDLAALTAHTGDEFAMFTRKGERLVVRGSGSQIPVTANMANRLHMQGYRWSGHTHPGTHPSSLIASDGDKVVLRAFRQSRGVIYNSTGRHSIFGRE